MADWNEQAAPNNNLPAKSIRSANLRLNRKNMYSSKAVNKQKNNNIF